MTQNYYTENLAEFGAREIHMLRDILVAWDDKGLPDDFNRDGAKPAFNKNSGKVFLVNDDYQVAMLNGDKLESFYNTPYHGHEGFLDELLDLRPDTLHKDDVEYILQIAEVNNATLPQTWAEVKHD